MLDQGDGRVQCAAEAMRGRAALAEQWETCSLRIIPGKGALLTVLFGLGLYLLLRLFKVAFDSAVSLLGIDFGDGFALGIIQAFLLSAAIDAVFMVAAVATGKYVLTRMVAGEELQQDDAASIPRMLALSFGLVGLRHVAFFLFIVLTDSAFVQSVGDEAANRLIELAAIAFHAGSMIVGVALGRYLLGRKSRKWA